MYLLILIHDEIVLLFVSHLAWSSCQGMQHVTLENVEGDVPDGLQVVTTGPISAKAAVLMMELRVG